RGMDEEEEDEFADFRVRTEEEPAKGKAKKREKVKDEGGEEEAEHRVQEDAVTKALRERFTKLWSITQPDHELMEGDEEEEYRALAQKKLDELEVVMQEEDE